ncbi:MAG: TetR/AcrR family transcriptional regulator C-terminal domain-containing protein [Pseudomonadota bacterium]
MPVNFGGRPQLVDLPRIIEAALKMGVDNLSMHGVARELGVSTPALYRYVPSKEALLDACMDHFCARIDMPDPDLPWQAYLADVGRAFRRALQNTPGASTYGFKIGPTTPAAFHIIDAALAVLYKAGFSPYHAFLAYSMIVDHAFTTAQKAERMTELEKENGPGGYRVLQLDPEALPELPHLAEALASVLTKGAQIDRDAGYEYQLTCLIAGLEQHLESID